MSARMDNDNNQLNEDIDHVAKEHSSDQLNIYLNQRRTRWCGSSA